ncbi:hypothetical protein GCK32_016143, partial [Trichostrongylus colubriformis]
VTNVLPSLPAALSEQHDVYRFPESENLPTNHESWLCSSCGNDEGCFLGPSDLFPGALSD